MRVRPGPVRRGRVPGHSARAVVRGPHRKARWSDTVRFSADVDSRRPEKDQAHPACRPTGAALDGKSRYRPRTDLHRVAARPARGSRWYRAVRSLDFAGYLVPRRDPEPAFWAYPLRAGACCYGASRRAAFSTAAKWRVRNRKQLCAPPRYS